MKKFNLLLLTFAMAFSFNISAQVDVSCTAVLSPKATDTLYSNSATVATQYTRKCVGATIPANGDTVWMNFFIDGQFAGRVSRNNTVAFMKDSSETRTGGSVDLSSFLTTTGFHDFCVAAIVKGDVDRSNDTMCVKLYYTSAKAPIDLAIANVAVTNPTPSNGNEFATDQSCDEISLTIKNVGGSAIAAGTRLPIDFTVGGNTVALFLTLRNAFNPGDSLNTRATRASVSSLPNFPSTLGNFDVCCKIKYSGDTDNSNDENCITYKMIPGTTPVITSFNPTSGPCLTKVTITGDNFSTTPTDNVVKFKTASAKVLTATKTQLEVEVPNGALSGKVSVTVNVGGVDKKGESAANFTYTGCTIGIDELGNSLYSVYYANDLVNISLGNNVVVGTKEVQIVNVSGQVVITKTMSFEGISEGNVINVSSLPAGAYVVTVDGNTTKFVK